MSGINVTPLFSGSSGNCTYISGGGTGILIDAGVSAARICAALRSINAPAPEAIFITHEHSDHIKGLDVLTRKIPVRVYMPRASYEKSSLKHTPLFMDECGKVTVSALTVRSFPLSHDTACCVGYTVEACGERVGIMTDTGYVTDEAVASLSGCTTVVIESNHDERMLRLGPYPRVLKERISSDTGHLSNSDCAAFCAFLASKGTKKFILAHLSRENNDCDIALECTRSVLPEGIECVCAPEAVI